MKLVLIAALAAALAAPAAFAHQSSTTLNGVVGPGFTITLTKAGTYVIKVADKATDHNFHLTGPGVNKTTSVGAKVNATWKVKLKKGTYKFVCDPHASFMKGAFTVS